MKSLVYIVLIFTTFVLNNTAAADAERDARAAYNTCLAFGEDAEAIQMIRQDGETLDQLLASLAIQIDEEYENGAKTYQVFLMEVKRIGQWVYAYYPKEWEPVMVGTTYTQNCVEYSMAQLEQKYPDIANNLNDQSRKAWEANH